MSKNSLALALNRPADEAVKLEGGVHGAWYSTHGKLQVATGADGWWRDWFTPGEAVGDLVSDDGAELGIGALFLVAVGDSAKVEVRAVADVALVLFGPADEAVVAVFRFHEWRFVLGFSLGNGFWDLRLRTIKVGRIVGSIRRCMVRH
jgi:hypothetical protein